jgi:peroxiredoxin
MKTMTRFMLAAAVFLMFSGGIAHAGSQPPAEGGLLPDIVLAVPKKPELQAYLGVTGKKTFAIPEIKADVVIIEIFSMYCPYCQKEAPAVNEMYREIENDDNLKDKIKLIGIGAGNSAFEVDYFKKNYNIPFPLFPDGDFAIHKKLGEVRTPFFIGVKILKDGSHNVYYSKLGGTGDAKSLMKKLLKGSGLD